MAIDPQAIFAALQSPATQQAFQQLQGLPQAQGAQHLPTPQAAVPVPQAGGMPAMPQMPANLAEVLARLQASGNPMAMLLARPIANQMGLTQQPTAQAPQAAAPAPQQPMGLASGLEGPMRSPGAQAKISRPGIMPVEGRPSAQYLGMAERNSGIDRLGFGGNVPPIPSY